MILQAPEFKVGRKRKWLLTEPMVYDSPLTGRVVIPVGFETDLASIPRVFRSVIDVNGRHRLPAVLHDYLYFCGGRLLNGSRLDRKRCDLAFIQAMELCNVPGFRRRLMYRAVRLGGWASFPDSDQIQANRFAALKLLEAMGEY